MLHKVIDFAFIDAMYQGKDDDASKAWVNRHYKSHISVPDPARVAEGAGAKCLTLHHLVPKMGQRLGWAEAASGFSGEFFIPEDLDVIPTAR